jgi:hypothetical protein
VSGISDIVAPCINETALMCPFCGDNNLHHDRVTVYSRKEDEDKILRTEICSGLVTVKRDEGHDNPSSRRDGIAIRFDCENCPAKPELTVSQHKGTTHVEWRHRHVQRKPMP